MSASTRGRMPKWTSETGKHASSELTRRTGHELGCVPAAMWRLPGQTREGDADGPAQIRARSDEREQGLLGANRGRRNDDVAQTEAGPSREGIYERGAESERCDERRRKARRALV